ncbi:MAG: hypothetical protein LBK42_12545 [Propionibacteriaceae bacterium]|jgi:hypothetical protein|nr:hypothetical protein [Propionibacteriaceae bacterium]
MAWIRRATLIGAAVVVLSLSACSSSKGGATTCGEYIDASANARRAAVVKMLEDRGESTSDASVTLNSASVMLFCQTLGQSTDTIEQIYG